MLTLTPDLKPDWLTVAEGVRLLLKPAESTTMLAGRAAAGEVITSGGAPADAEFAFTAASVIWAALDWEGVGDAAGNPAPLTPENLTRLLAQNPAVFDKIDRAYVVPMLMRDAEKNGSSPLPSGTSAGAKATARPVRGSAPSARMKKAAVKPTKARGSGT